MRVLVTGASGMLGCNLVSLLRERGYEIVAMVNKGSLKKRPWAREVLDGVDLLEARVEDFRGSLEVDAVFHLAAVLRGPTTRVNYRGTVNILKRVKAGTFVFVSSILALGDGLREGASEETPCKPVTGYERSKCDAERAVLTHPSPIVLRPGWIYGPYSLNPDIPLLARLVKRGIRPIFVSENLPLALVHAKDVARAAMHLLEGGYTGVYNVRGPRMYTMGELVDVMGEVLGRWKGGGIHVRVPSALVRLASRFFDVIRYFELAPPDVPVDKLIGTGFKPEVDLRVGMEEALRWMMEWGVLR